MSFNWVGAIPAVISILSGTAAALGKNSDGGKKITPAERDEILAEAAAKITKVLASKI